MAVGLLLTALPIYIFHKFGVRLIGSAVTAIIRMVAQLGLIALYMHYLFEWNNPWANLLWLLLMALVATFAAIRQTRLRPTIVMLPLMVGLTGAALVAGMYFLVPVLRLAHPFDARHFIPVMGIIAGGMPGVCITGLSTFYDSLQHDRRLYFYLLGNGATHTEAVAPFMRRAIEKAFAPCIADMTMAGIVSLPLIMLGQMLGGAAPVTAVKYQIVLMGIMFSASMLALITTLYLCDRRSFDIYGRLRNYKMSKQK